MGVHPGPTDPHDPGTSDLGIHPATMQRNRRSHPQPGRARFAGSLTFKDKTKLREPISFPDTYLRRHYRAQ